MTESTVEMLPLAVVMVDGRFGRYRDLDTWWRALCSTGAVADDASLTRDGATAVAPSATGELVVQVLRRALVPATLRKAHIGVVVAGDDETAAAVAQAVRGLGARRSMHHVSTVVRALDRAGALLADGTADLVVVAAGEGTDVGALVLTPLASVQAADALAVLRGLQCGPLHEGRDVCRSALRTADAAPSQVGYLETSVWPPDPAVVQTYRAATDAPTCVVSTTAPVGGASVAVRDVGAAMAALIKAVLCVHDRILPSLHTSAMASVVEGQGGASAPEGWDASPFYVAPLPRPWLSNPNLGRRLAAVSLVEGEEIGHLLLAEPADDRGGPMLRAEAVMGTGHLIPVAGEDEATLHAALEALERAVANSQSVADVARQALNRYRSRAARYALGLIAHDRETLIKEIAHAHRGVERAFSQGQSWQTPRGSAFTAQPLGKAGVTFVYPGAFNSYVGLGRELFQHFPFLHEDFGDLVSNLDWALAAPLLYPRSRWLPDETVPQTWTEALRAQPTAVMASGTIFSIAYTAILSRLFDVAPRTALGYSLGEASMLWATGVWRNGDEGIARLYASPLFKGRLTGAKHAVREAWGVAPDSDVFWSVYLLKASRADVEQAVRHEPRVHVTIVNLPNEIVIAGAAAACQRVIAALDCHALPVPSDVVIHHPAMHAEYERLHDLYSHPVAARPEVTFYSADTYGPLVLEREALAASLARMTCQPVDFPRLVERAYEDGARLFVELGPQGTCARWITRLLRGRPHAAVAIDGTVSDTSGSDFDGVLKVLATLITHRVPVNLAPLLEDGQREPIRVQLASRAQTKSPSRIVRGDRVLPSQQEQPARVQENRPQPATASAVDQPAAMLSVLEGALPTIVDIQTSRESMGVADGEIASPLIRTYIQHLLPHRARATQAHEAFLDIRRDAQQQVQKLIELQIQAGRRVLDDAATQVDGARPPAPQFDEIALRAFAEGDPEACFGVDFALYRGRRLPRIPNGDLLLMSRIMHIDGTPGAFEGSPSLQSQYDVPTDAWFYGGRTTPGLPPYAVLMEMALQPCGFLSAYLRSSLLAPEADLYFRNLDGHGRILADLDVRGKRVDNRVELLSSHRGPGTILQAFNYALSCEGERFYEGWSLFGYFTQAALVASTGLEGQAWSGFEARRESAASSRTVPLPPTTPQLDFLHSLEAWPEGGMHGKGYLQGRVAVSPRDWFFRAHFHQDPVMPGSLGLQAVLQAIEAYARWRYPTFKQAQPAAVVDHTLNWTYRGQVPPEEGELVVEVHISDVNVEDTEIKLVGDAGVSRAGVLIYGIKNIAVRLAR